MLGSWGQPPTFGSRIHSPLRVKMRCTVLLEPNVSFGGSLHFIIIGFLQSACAQGTRSTELTVRGALPRKKSTALWLASPLNRRSCVDARGHDISGPGSSRGGQRQRKMDSETTHHKLNATLGGRRVAKFTSLLVAAQVTIFAGDAGRAVSKLARTAELAISRVVPRFAASYLRCRDSSCYDGLPNASRRCSAS